MGGPEHAHLAGARSQLPRRWSLYLRFLDVWPHSSLTTCPIYKFDRSIDSATQGLLSTSLAARRNQLPLCCDTKHVAQEAPFVLSVKRIRFKPLDPFFQNLREMLHRNSVSVFLLTPYTDWVSSALKYSPKSKKYFSNPKSPCKHDANMWCREQLGVGWQFHGSGMHPWQTGVACCRLQAIHTSTGDL